MAVVLETKDLFLKPAEISFAQAVLDYYERNRAFLTAFEPERAPSFYTIERQEAMLREDIADAEQKTGIHFYIFPKADPKTVIGSVSLSHIVWGCFLSGFLGYKLDEKRLNKGYMTQAIGAVACHAFDELGLHRIEANVMPTNMPSRRVLDKCGFRDEGLAKRYLKINGVWEDHIHMVLLSDDK